MTGWTVRVQWYQLTKVQVEQLECSVDSMSAESTCTDIAFLLCCIVLCCHYMYTSSLGIIGINIS